MGGGLMQLVLVGNNDQYIIQNPQISYFKYAYKKHTNFSMESIRLDFDTNPNMRPNADGNSYICKIKRYADLLSQVYFCFTLPDIYSSDKYKFRWIENIGNIFIKEAVIKVGNVEIDKIVGEWLSIWNELSLKDSASYNYMVGNTKELTNPTINMPRIGIRNNKFYYVFYPESAKGQNPPMPPSIKSKRLYVPLNFWFTRNPALALPLLKLQLAEISITIQVRRSEELYQVYSTILDTYVSPTYYNTLHAENININTFTISAGAIAIDPYIEANYIFLGNIERNSIIQTPNIQYLVDTVKIINDAAVSSKSSAVSTITVTTNVHTKEIVWTLRRDDYLNYNIFNNYSASPTYNQNSKIMTNAQIMWNNTNSRIDKDADYFSFIQPYQHHTNVPRIGIYCYSFALFPEKVNPTGSYNAGRVSTKLLINVDASYNNVEINEKLVYNNKSPYEFDYLITVYSITLNVFEVQGGLGAMKFST